MTSVTGRVSSPGWRRSAIGRALAGVSLLRSTPSAVKHHRHVYRHAYRRVHRHAYRRTHRHVPRTAENRSSRRFQRVPAGVYQCIRKSTRTQGHNNTGHNYMKNNNTGHNYMKNNYTGHNSPFSALSASGYPCIRNSTRTQIDFFSFGSPSKCMNTEVRSGRG